MKRLLMLFCFISFLSVVGISQEKKITPPKNDSLASDSASRWLLINKAKEFIGVKYRRGQSNKNGFDCSGYVKYIYSFFDYSLPHNSKAQYKCSKKITHNEAQPGDLVFFKIRGRNISHVGIYLGNHQFIHSPSRGKRVCVSSLQDAYYKRHLAGFGTVLKK